MYSFGRIQSRASDQQLMQIDRRTRSFSQTSVGLTRPSIGGFTSEIEIVTIQ